MTGGFVTALISLTGDLRTYWPLYLVPIVIAALAYHVGGAVVASALVAALVALLVPEASAGSTSVPQLGVGIAVFLLSGVVIGAQAHRQRQHSEVLEQASIRDQLTGLYKADYLHNRLNEEIHRCDRYSVPVAFGVVAVDGYPDFKERFGHYKADLMLEHMADLVRISVRDTDIVARYSPTEFAVVLPFSSTEQAGIVAVRIERAVAGAEFEGDVIDPVAKLTVSLGMAAYPGEANTEDELVRLALDRLGPRATEVHEPAPGGIGNLREVTS
jgi:diguanylate cyclase (GGDEF)-like protein